MNHRPEPMVWQRTWMLPGAVEIRGGISRATNLVIRDACLDDHEDLDDYEGEGVPRRRPRASVF